MSGLSRARDRRRIVIAAAATSAAAAVHFGAPQSPAFEVASFLFAAAALIGLTSVVTAATRQIDRRFGPTVAAMLNVTAGNLPEWFVVLFSISTGQLVVARAAIVGSVLANGLLLLGLVIVIGSARRRDGAVRFAPAPLLQAISLTGLAVVPAWLAGVRSSASTETLALIAVAPSLIALYAWSLVRQLRVSGAASRPTRAPGTPAFALTILVTAGAAALPVSDWLVESLSPAAALTHLSPSFVGVAVIGVAGNLVEHLGAIVFAWEGRTDLGVGIATESVSQVIAFVLPVAALASVLTSTPLAMGLPGFYSAALLAMVGSVWAVAVRGRAGAWQGAVLLAVWLAIVAVAAGS
jgi:Ca2+:H+ antiporter